MVDTENQLKILVLGCSSAGKSTFITSTLIPVLEENQNLQTQDDIDVFFAGRLKPNYDLGKKKCAIIHYNTLLAFDSNPEGLALNIKNEYVFNKILRDSFDEVFFCYTPDAILLERVKNRVLVEPEILGSEINKYPKEHILNSVSKISQRGTVLEIYSYLQDVVRNFSVVFSQHKTSMVIPICDFIQAPRSAFLENVLSDEKCNIELLRREFHRYSSLAAKCAVRLSR